MEKIKQYSLADNFLFDFEAELDLLNGDAKAYDRVMAKKIDELDKYLQLRVVKEPMGDESFRDLISSNKGLTELYDTYELPFGGVPPALELKDLQDYVRDIKHLSQITEDELPPEVLK